MSGSMDLALADKFYTHDGHNHRKSMASLPHLYIVKTKVGRARQIVSSNTPIAYLVCCG